MELQALVAAVDFAARKHKDQRRKDKEKTPYINHPIGKFVIRLAWAWPDLNYAMMIGTDIVIWEPEFVLGVATMPSLLLFLFISFFSGFVAYSVL